MTSPFSGTQWFVGASGNLPERRKVWVKVMNNLHSPVCKLTLENISYFATRYRQQEQFIHSSLYQYQFIIKAPEDCDTM